MKSMKCGWLNGCRGAATRERWGARKWWSFSPDLDGCRHGHGDIDSDAAPPTSSRP